MKRTLCTLTISTALSCSLAYAGSNTTLSVGGTYSEGDYGTETTTSTYYLPVVATYQKNMFSASVTIPYIRIDSKGSFTWTSAGPVPILPSKPTDLQAAVNSDPFNPSNPTSTSKRTTTEGLGDILLNTAYTFVPTRGVYLKTSFIMKVATADEEKGLGTGENDYSLQADVYKPVGQSFVFGTVGYTITGNSDTIEYNDIWYGTLGAGHRLNRKLSIGFNYAYRQSLFDSLDATQTASLFCSYSAKSALKYDLSYTHGFSDTAADHAVTLTVTKRF